MIVSDGPLLAPHDEKLLETFTMLRGIPRRCFRALFGEELEVKAIKDGSAVRTGSEPEPDPMEPDLNRTERDYGSTILEKWESSGGGIRG